MERKAKELDEEKQIGGCFLSKRLLWNFLGVGNPHSERELVCGVQEENSALHEAVRHRYKSEMVGNVGVGLFVLFSF